MWAVPIEQDRAKIIWETIVEKFPHVLDNK